MLLVTRDFTLTAQKIRVSPLVNIADLSVERMGFYHCRYSQQCTLSVRLGSRCLDL